MQKLSGNGAQTAALNVGRFSKDFEKTVKLEGFTTITGSGGDLTNLEFSYGDKTESTIAGGAFFFTGVEPNAANRGKTLSIGSETAPVVAAFADIANAGKISISSCNTIYKKYLKESPIKHLLNYRLMKSCELLIENALSVTEIAFDVGFANTSYYIDTFKKRYGCTPNEYRKRNKLSEIFTPNTDSFL